MGKLIQQLLCVSALAFLALALGAQPALASDADCPSISACSFFADTVVASKSAGVSTGSWTANFKENVYQTGMEYTYVFDLELLTFKGTALNSISTGAGASVADLFDQTLNWGVIFSGVAGNPFPSTTSPVDDNGFVFGSSTLQATPTNMDTAGRIYEFYAQSFAPPVSGQFNISDGGNVTTDSWDPTPEPGSILLFGTGLLMLGLILRRRLPQLPQPR